MAFEPIYDTAVFDTFRKLGTGQAVVEARLLPRPEIRIAKVLSTSSSVGISAAEAFSGEARYSGRVNFKVLFETTEGTAEELDYNADFSDKVEANGIGASTKTIFSANILDMDIIAAEEDVIKLAAVVEVTLYGCTREDIKYLARGGDGVYTHEDRVNCSALASETDETFIISDTLEIGAGVEILGAESRVFTYKRTAEDDSVTFAGEAVVDLTLKNADGAISCKSVAIPVEQQCRADGARERDAVTGGLKIKDCAVTVSGEENERVAEIELTLKAECMSFRSLEMLPAVDVFCLENELLPTVESVVVGCPKNDITLESTVEGSVAIEDKLPLADTVLGTFGSRVNVSTATAEAGRVKIEGLLGTNIVYFSAERGSSNTVYAQVPFSLTLSADVEEGDTLGAQAGVKDVSVKIRRGNELGIRAEVVVSLSVIAEETQIVITELKLGEARPPRRAAISVHIASNGETVWDAAKALGITPEEVVRQNPDVSMPCSGGERLRAFRRIER
ncbi:MAG: DUF3794 domain-containing protein [Clostridia bacterium]|nr:DUF3794 domain-containing protein [Clostridia bacterium]